jgi:hypothetical protein
MMMISFSPIPVMKVRPEVIIVMARSGWGLASIFHLTTCDLIRAFETAHQGTSFGCVLVPILLFGMIVVPEGQGRAQFFGFKASHLRRYAADVAVRNACVRRGTADDSGGDCVYDNRDDKGRY